MNHPDIGWSSIDCVHVHSYTGRRHQKSHVPAVEMRTNSRIGRINPAIVPSTAQAVAEYTNSGGHLTDPHDNCVDPLYGNQVKKDMRESAFLQQFPSLHTIFHSLVNYDSSQFVCAINLYVNITFRLANS